MPQRPGRCGFSCNCWALTTISPGNTSRNRRGTSLDPDRDRDQHPGNLDLICQRLDAHGIGYRDITRDPVLAEF